MKQCGVVMSIEADRAKVVMQRHASCGDCNACNKGNEAMSMEIEAINSVNAKIGDKVEIDMENQNILAAAFIVYVIPLFTLIVGVVLGNILLERMGVLQYKEIGSALIGFILTFISFLIIKSKEGSIKNNKSFIPVITDIVIE